MKDCSTCKNSVTRRPELEGTEWEKSPCFKCKPFDPAEERAKMFARDMLIMSYDDNFETPLPNTWKILSVVTDEPYRSITTQYMRYLRMDAKKRGKVRTRLYRRGRGRLERMVFKFSVVEEGILALCASKGWSFSQSGLARDCGCSKQYIHKIINKIGEIAPYLRPILTGGGK